MPNSTLVEDGWCMQESFYTFCSQLLRHGCHCSISCDILTASFPSPESCDLSLTRGSLLFSFRHSLILLPTNHGWFFIPGISILFFSSQSICKIRCLASSETFLLLGKTTVLDTWNIKVILSLQSCLTVAHLPSLLDCFELWMFPLHHFSHNLFQVLRWWRVKDEWLAKKKKVSIVLNRTPTCNIIYI